VVDTNEGDTVTRGVDDRMTVGDRFDGCGDSSLGTATPTLDLGWLLEEVDRTCDASLLGHPLLLFVVPFEAKDSRRVCSSQ
jgi:hypothetical protein